SDRGVTTPRFGTGIDGAERSTGAASDGAGARRYPGTSRRRAALAGSVAAGASFVRFLGTARGLDAEVSGVDGAFARSRVLVSAGRVRLVSTDESRGARAAGGNPGPLTGPLDDPRLLNAAVASSFGRARDVATPARESANPR